MRVLVADAVALGADGVVWAMVKIGEVKMRVAARILWRSLSMGWVSLGAADCFLGEGYESGWGSSITFQGNFILDALPEFDLCGRES